MARSGDASLYASPLSSPGPATPPPAATLLYDCEVSPLSLPAPREPPAFEDSVLSTRLRRQELGGARDLTFTYPTPSPPTGRRNAIAQETNTDPSFNIDSLNDYTMARGNPPRKSSLKYEYIRTSDDEDSGDDIHPGRKLSTSSKGDPVVFTQLIRNTLLVYSDPSHPSYTNPMTSDKVPLDSKGRAIAPPEPEPLEPLLGDDDDDCPTSPKSLSPTSAGRYDDGSADDTKLGRGLGGVRLELASKSPPRFAPAHLLRSSTNSTLDISSSAYGASGSGSGTGSSSAAGRVWSGASKARQRDSSLPTTHMPSSPTQLYRPPHLHDSRYQSFSFPTSIVRPAAAPADVAEIFSQRGHASANGQPPVRPFEAAQFIPDMYQSFAGLPQLGVQLGAAYTVGAQTGLELPFRYGHTAPGRETYPQLYAASFNPQAQDFVPYQQCDGTFHQQQQPYAQQPYSQHLYVPYNLLPQLPPPQTRYKGAGSRSHTSNSQTSGDTSIGNPHIPSHLNTCLWIEGCPPDMTYSELLSSIHNCGRIFCSYINAPQRGHLTAACKVAFFSRAGAERLLTQSYNGEFVIRGVPMRRLVWNRNAYTGHPDPVATRVLLIRGPVKWVNLHTLTHYFRALFWWHIIRIEDIPLSVAAELAGDDGWLESGVGGEKGIGGDHLAVADEYREMAAMRWEFGSFHAQAQAAKLACERETAFMGLVRVDYLPDGCDYRE